MNDPTCTAPECAKRTVARGWCTMHYNRWRTFGTLDPVKKCVDCDTLIPRGRAVKVRCDFCAKDVAHQRNVDKWAETRAERATFTCRGCEGEFPRTESGRKRKWCDDCREQEKRRQSRRTCEIELAAKRVLFSQVGRISHCYRCSTEIENGRIGMKRLTCDDCRAKGYRSPVRRGTPTYGNVACQDCGGEFPNRSHNKTSKYCEPCTAKRCVVRRTTGSGQIQNDHAITASRRSTSAELAYWAAPSNDSRSVRSSFATSGDAESATSGSTGSCSIPTR